MRCPNCKKEASPLVLRTGLVCPECLKSFVNDEIRTDFKFTKENDETFHLSEAAFFRGVKERDQKRVDLAINLCRAAFEAGNPEAYVRMGYYYEKNLITENNGKSSGTMEKRYRLLIAYEYYSLVCNGMLVPGDLDQHRSFEELQKTAADRLLRLLAELPAEEQKNPRYSVRAKQSELAKKGLVDASTAFSDAKKQDVSVTLTKDVPDMLDKQQNVLIAVYGIRGADLLSLLPEKGKEAEWKDNFLYRAARSQELLFRYYLNTSKNDLKASPVDARRFGDFLEKVEKGVRQNPDCVFRLLFFNGKYKPVRFKKNSDMKKIVEEALMGNSGTIDKIADMNEDVSRFVFYEDEVYYCVRKRGMKQLSASFWDYFRGELK